jgi:30S ribosomal protein S31
MGKGDKRTAKGKRVRGTFGKSRPRKKKSGATPPAKGKS